MEDCKYVSTPLDAGLQTHCTNNCERVKNEKYQSIIGAFTYLAITSRPDIQHSVSTSTTQPRSTCRTYDCSEA